MHEQAGQVAERRAQQINPFIGAQKGNIAAPEGLGQMASLACPDLRLILRRERPDRTGMTAIEYRADNQAAIDRHRRIAQHQQGEILFMMDMHLMAFMDQSIADPAHALGRILARPKQRKIALQRHRIRIG